MFIAIFSNILLNIVGSNPTLTTYFIKRTMIIYKNYSTFHVLGLTVNLITQPYLDGLNTVAEIKDKYYYLGNQTANVLAAIFAWELFWDKEISDEDFEKVLLENNIGE
jgi:hypothetical protein